ncbi:hypothetical protein D3C71_1150210 [compost metagenome]
MRGKVLSAAPNTAFWLLISSRLLNEPSTVRKPSAIRALGSSDARSTPAACASAILIWSRMNCRSEPMKCTPSLTTPFCSLSSGAGGTGGVPGSTASVCPENTVSYTPVASW